jgi:hypothetical protein
VLFVRVITVIFVRCQGRHQWGVRVIHPGTHVSVGIAKSSINLTQGTIGRLYFSEWFCLCLFPVVLLSLALLHSMSVSLPRQISNVPLIYRSFYAA